MGIAQFSEDVLLLNPELAENVRARVRLGKFERQPNFHSKTEMRAWRDVVPLLGAVKALYEPFAVHITGGSYTPDFVLVMPDGEQHIIEVKGNWNAYASGRSSLHNLKQASIEFAWLGRWFSLLPDNKRKLWMMEEFIDGKAGKAVEIQP